MMVDGPTTTSQRSVSEWTLRSGTRYLNPFVDVTMDATFVSPTGQSFTIPAFHDGDDVWRVRFNPGEPGRWTYRTATRPADRDLSAEGSFEVVPSSIPGFLTATPGEAWGFRDESGEPVFIFGDTVYNLFGMAYCGADVESFLGRRAEQGFNLLRVRLPVSPFHPPDGYNTWQNRRTWPWGGSEQAPRFDRFNLEYFHTVDQVVREAERLGIGLEMIMEAWGFEFPFNSRQIFVAEWEELWMRYLIARYDAFRAVAVWTLMNEYEYYPNGDWHYKPVADRWAMRMARWVKSVACHGHPVAVHNGPRLPPFAQRFAADPEAIDVILFQDWGTRDEENGWLAAGIEDAIERGLDGWSRSAIFAEWGYERNPDFPLLLPSHQYCDPDHTRRGAWRGAFRGLGVVHGFENSWGPFMRLEEDQPGLAYLLHLRRFFTSIVPFERLRPASELVVPTECAPGHRPLVLATAERDLIAVYLPVGGVADLRLNSDGALSVRWFDPRRGEMTGASVGHSPGQQGGARFQAPDSQGERPDDWVLVLSRNRQ